MPGFVGSKSSAVHLELPAEVYSNPNRPMDVSMASAGPDKFIYENVICVSGPQGPTSESLVTDSSATDSIFEYQVPAEKIALISLVNFFFADMSIKPTSFAGISNGLANGCLFQVIDSDGVAILLDFFGGTPLVTNDQFVKIAGRGSVSNFSTGSADLLAIGITIEKVGKPMRLTAGQRIRWTNRDNLSTIINAAMMVQGVYL